MTCVGKILIDTAYWTYVDVP